MNRKKIIEAAIQKAIDNDFEFTDGKHYFMDGFKVNSYTGKHIEAYGEVGVFEFNIIETIFSHEFAKAIWGNKEFSIPRPMMDDLIIPYWQHHLQQMVIADDPIEYLRKFI